VRIGRLNVPVHGGRKGIKRQQVLFILRQTAYRFPDSAERTWRFSAAREINASGFVGCSPSAHEFSLHIPTLSFWDEHSGPLRCLCDLSALTRGSRKQLLD
jgi:hypothetical protein